VEVSVELAECFDLGHDADIGVLRRRFAALASKAGLDESRTSDASIVAAELASNVIKHAQHGGALVGARGGEPVIAAWDRGPGMNVEACLRDGVSTAGTAGHGLGAVARLATWWDAYAPPGGGSIVAAGMAAAPASAFELGCVCVPYPGLEVSGDAWDVHVAGDVATLMVVDGLGHGDGAADAAAAVIRAFRVRPDDALPSILTRAHAAARPTRGAAATCVRVFRSTGLATVAGVGNVGAWIVAGRTRQLVTQHGTLGQVLPNVREETHEFPPGAHLVVCSDGIKSRGFGDTADLFAHRPATIATALWRDYRRDRDDTTVVVVRGAR
jgi:anti-sigma regulatory factor (Ser/Thr protein kinase)